MALHKWQQYGKVVNEKDRMIIRLTQLCWIEFINIFLLPLAFWAFAHTRNQLLGLNSVVAMAINGVLLFEGSYFWFCIRQQLRVRKEYHLEQGEKYVSGPHH